MITYFELVAFGATIRAQLIVKFMTEAVTIEEREAMREILAGNG